MLWRRMTLVALLAVGIAAMTSSMKSTAGENSSSVTFYKDVLPILQKNCQTCHRPGEIAPMSFMTYKDTRPWAKGIKTAVVSRQMPPWFAAPNYGHFVNERTLSDPAMGRKDAGIDLLGKFNPGLGAQDFSLFESAKFVPKGSDIVFNMHYTATGKETTDRSRLAIVFAKNPPKYRYYVDEGPTAGNLAIPAGDPNAEVVSEMTAQIDTQLVYMQPHMHLRGKDYEVRLIYPDGKMQTVFRTKWDFNWQIGVDLVKPIPIPKGTRVIGIAHFDNSANNKWNPDPTKLVFWGLQNWEEMQNCFMGYLLDPNFKDVRNIFKRSGPSLLPRSTSGPALSTLVIK